MVTIVKIKSNHNIIYDYYNMEGYMALIRGYKYSVLLLKY